MKIGVIFIISLLLLSGVVIGRNISYKNDQGIVINDPEFFLSLGDYLFNNGRLDYAVLVYEKGLEMFPENTRLLNNLGIAYLDLDIKKSEQLFEKALLIEPDYEHSLRNLALLYHKIEDFENAAKHFLILAEKYPNNIEYSYDLAVNLGNKFYHETKSLDDLELALEYYYQVLDKSPGFEAAENNIAVLEEIKDIYLERSN